MTRTDLFWLLWSCETLGKIFEGRSGEVRDPEETTEVVPWALILGSKLNGCFRIAADCQAFWTRFLLRVTYSSSLLIIASSFAAAS